MGNCCGNGDTSEESPPAASCSTELRSKINSLQDSRLTDVREENTQAAISSTEQRSTENPPGASSFTKQRFIDSTERRSTENPPEASSSIEQISMQNPPGASSSTDLLEENPPVASSSTELPEELQECVSDFNSSTDPDKIDHFLCLLKETLREIKSKRPYNSENASTSSELTQGRNEESSMWTSITKRGSKLLVFLSKLKSSEKLHRWIRVAAETLQQGGILFPLMGALSTIAFVLFKFEDMRDTQPKCLETLEDLVDLASHLRSLKKMIPEEEEKFTEAIQLIIRGSITCLRQLESNGLFRFIKSSVNSDDLMNLRDRIRALYPNLELSAIIDIRKDIPTYLPILPPTYPKEAVGIDMQVNEILDILRREKSSLAFVIYGFGGLGKTTIAEAVVAKLDLKKYKYSSIEIYQEQEKNDFTKSQQQILKDCFPDYNGGQPIMLRDCKDGRHRLMEAFKCHKEKPIFLFIDNASKSADLKNLLPQEFGGLPQGSRILITSRRLVATDMFEGQPNLVRKPWPLQPLPRDDALKILFNDSPKPRIIKDEDLNRIIRICSGVPLALKIVGAQLHKQSYQVDRCANILGKMETGDTIKEEKLSERLVDFVYGELEEYSKEALLDICCFFSKWSRQDVEFVVGGDAVTSLLEAGLITSTLKHNSPRWEELTVHDIIRAKGRFLAKDNRIFDIDSLCEAADEERLHLIKGLWLVNEKSEYIIDEKHLNQMRKSLRILALGERMKVSIVSQKKFAELKFLQVPGDISQLPVKLTEDDKLSVFHGPFFTEGEVSLCKLPKSLRAVKVICQVPSPEYTNCEMTGAPLCSSLQILDFSELWELPRLPKGFNQLVSLKNLILDGLEQMGELPEQICQLPTLEVLSMMRCSGLKCLPESFGQLNSLEVLDLYGCRKLEKLPSTFGQLTALMDLNLNGCYNLEALPTCFEQLRSLQHLECASKFVRKVESQMSQVVINEGFFFNKEKLRLDYLDSKYISRPR